MIANLGIRAGGPRTKNPGSATDKWSLKRERDRYRFARGPKRPVAGHLLAGELGGKGRGAGSRKNLALITHGQNMRHKKWEGQVKGALDALYREYRTTKDPARKEELARSGVEYTVVAEDHVAKKGGKISPFKKFTVSASLVTHDNRGRVIKAKTLTLFSRKSIVEE